MNQVDKYIAGFPDETREGLAQLRTAILKAAPEAEEVISYGMPAYKQHGILVYFAGHKNHIGFYPMARAIEKFKDELSAYKTSKGTIQFPAGKAVPVRLVTKIMKFRVLENTEKHKLKSKKK